MFWLDSMGVVANAGWQIDPCNDGIVMVERLNEAAIRLAFIDFISYSTSRASPLADHLLILPHAH